MAHTKTDPLLSLFDIVTDTTVPDDATDTVLQDVGFLPKQDATKRKRKRCDPEAVQFRAEFCAFVDSILWGTEM